MLATCPSCTHENRPAAFFCAQCGSKLHFGDTAPTLGRLARMNGPHQGRKVEMPSPVCILGRDPSCTVHLEEESVSKQHARLVFENGQYHIEDLGSSNGTFVNGRRIHGRCELRSGDLVRLGAVILKLEA